MKNLCFLILLTLCILTAGNAQQASVKGIITDTLNKQHLENATVTLLLRKDSVLYKFTRTKQDGTFSFPKVNAGKYVLMITYPDYADFMDEITISDTSHLQLNNLALITKANLLEEVIVRQKIAPVRFKGDTLEIIADSFHVRAGANVEDLIKKFPGFTVNSKGEITAQGQKIEKVLVDGEEFFGDDPTMATQNLNAKDIAKVQMYDKKSDQSVLTGIDDGQKQKTLNLILKEDAKKGYFGRAEAGTDFNKYYQGKGTFNRFTSTMKTGAYVTADRTGKNDMNWTEMQDYGMISSSVEGGNVSFSWEGDDFDNYNLQGIPENLVTAAMFNKKFGALKNNTTNNYSFKHQNNAGESTTNSTYILPDSVYYNNQTNHFNNSKWQHSFYSKNEFNLDSLNTLTLNVKGSFGHTRTASNFNSEYLSSTLQKVNTNTRTNTADLDNNMQKADIFFKHKFNKAGTRILTVNSSITNSNSTDNGFLYNETDYYSSNIINSTTVIDQKKTSAGIATAVQGLVSYTEPLSKKLSLNLNYIISSSNNEQDTKSFDKNNGVYDSLNLLYSNHYKFQNTAERGGFLLNYNSKKLTAKGGLAIQDLSMKQHNLYNDSSFQRNFTNYFPTANIRWKFSGAGSLYVNYDGSTRQPSLSQIQPIANNTDPLNIIQGNPNLKPSFVHNIYLNFNDYKVLSQRGIWGYGNISVTQNAFSSRVIIDSLGRRISQTVNVNGNFNYYGGFSYSRQIKFMKLDLGIGPRIDGSRNINFINGTENITNSFNLGLNLRANKYIEKKLDFYLGYNPLYSHSVSSINTTAKTNYWSHTISNNFSYHFIKNWNLNSNIDAKFRQKLNPTDNKNNAIVWDASAERKILKKQDLWLIFSVNDILNQNIGFNRNISSNFISENTYTTVQRYFLLSLRWKFSKNRKTNDDDN